MFSLQPTVPINFTEIERKRTVVFRGGDDKVGGTGENFHGEITEFGVDAVELVDYCTQGGILVQDDSPDQAFVW